MFNRWKAYPKHIPKSVVGIYAQLDMVKNQDKHMLWIYFGRKDTKMER